MSEDQRLVFAGQMIREKREALNLSQKDLAAALTREGYTVTTSTVGRIEAGQNSKSHFGNAKFVAALTRILQFSRYDLLSAAGIIRDMRQDNRAQRMVELVSDLEPADQELVEDFIKLLLSKHEQKK